MSLLYSTLSLKDLISEDQMPHLSGPLTLDWPNSVALWPQGYHGKYWKIAILQTGWKLWSSFTAPAFRWASCHQVRFVSNYSQDLCKICQYICKNRKYILNSAQILWIVWYKSHLVAAYPPESRGCEWAPKNSPTLKDSNCSIFSVIALGSQTNNIRSVHWGRAFDPPDI